MRATKSSEDFDIRSLGRVDCRLAVLLRARRDRGPLRIKQPGLRCHNAGTTTMSWCVIGTIDSKTCMRYPDSPLAVETNCRRPGPARTVSECAKAGEGKSQYGKHHWIGQRDGKLVGTSPSKMAFTQQICCEIYKGPVMLPKRWRRLLALNKIYEQLP